MKRISSLLIVAALITAMAGCSGISPSGGNDYGESYAITIISTAGGSVTTPGEGTFTYAEGKVVNLLAEPKEGYHFVSWTGDVGTLANVNSALTTITTSDSYSIRANFLEGSSLLGINYTEEEVEQLIIVLVNAERQQFELGTLSEDPLLTSLAREHSISMVENGFFSHDRHPGERFITYNMTPGTTRGENIAKIPTRQMFQVLISLYKRCVSGQSQAGWIVPDTEQTYYNLFSLRQVWGFHFQRREPSYTHT